MSHKEIHNIIRRPIITEKSIQCRESLNQVTFQVRSDANKIEIRNAIEKLLDTRVLSVNTMIVRGKNKRVGRFSGRRSNWKKAIVTLAEGETIEALDLMDQLLEDELEGED